MVQPLWKTVWQSLTKLNIVLQRNPAFLLLVIIVLQRNPAFLLLVIYVNRLKIYIHTKTCTWMFIAVLLVIAKT